MSRLSVSFEKMINSVFSPQSNERVLVVTDEPVSSFSDSVDWLNRRSVAFEWFQQIQEIGKKNDFFVDFIKFDAVGEHNKLIDAKIMNKFAEFNIIIALTEFSITSSLAYLIKRHSGRIRCASLPQADIFRFPGIYYMSYDWVSVYAHRLKSVLTDAIGADILFTTGDLLFIDLRNRIGGADDGLCREAGHLINLPSGEGFCAPYEGVDDERDIFGVSKTHGILPIFFQDRIIKAEVVENAIVGFTGASDEVKKLKSVFSVHKNRKNIAELGIGCNSQVKVTGNPFIDEKAGVHIAYGMSRHLGGKIDCDLHYDLVFAKGCEVEVECLKLLFAEGSFMDVVLNGDVQYDMLQ